MSDKAHILIDWEEDLEPFEGHDIEEVTVRSPLQTTYYQLRRPKTVSDLTHVANDLSPVFGANGRPLEAKDPKPSVSSMDSSLSSATAVVDVKTAVDEKCCSMSAKNDSEVNDPMSALNFFGDYLKDAINDLSSDSSLTPEEWYSRLERGFKKKVFDDFNDAEDMAHVYGLLKPLADGLKTVSSIDGCVGHHLKAGSDELLSISGVEVVKDTTTQTDISGSVLSEEIYHN